jgi:hypothetical protein
MEASMKMMLDTKIYNDKWFYSLSTEAKLLFLFLIGNDSCNLIGCYELPINIIATYTKIPEKKIESIFEELFPKVAYGDGWVMIQRYQKYNPMRNPSIEEAKIKQMESLPADIRAVFEEIQLGIDDLKQNSLEKQKEFLKRIENELGWVHPDTRVVPGIKEQDKEKDIVLKGDVKRGIESISGEDIQKICTDYQVPESFVRSKMDDMNNWMKSKGKSYRDYNAALRNWVKRDSLSLRKEASQHESKRGIDARGIV